METVSDRIKRLRLAHDLTQEELGAVLGVGKATVQKYESGQIQNLKAAQSVWTMVVTTEKAAIFPDIKIILV